MRLIRRLANQRGTSTLEFVVVLPIALLIFLASLELSRAWFTVNIMVNAAREGARWGVATETFTPDLPGGATDNNRMKAVLIAANLPTDRASVTCTSVDPTSPDPCPRDSEVKASVIIDFSIVAPGILWMLDNPLPLTETVRMRRE
jgi:hypothetical protein